MINYDGRRFRTIENSSSGETGRQTIFEYHQDGEIVWADYSGGGLVCGHLIAACDPEGRLNMRYHHINGVGELLTGVCTSSPELLPDGRLRLHEKWQWTCRDHSHGTSVLEEI